MTELQRLRWLEMHSTQQLRALLVPAGLYSIGREWGRPQLLQNLQLVEGIEIPKEAT
jgi:hypothetical protein